MSTSKRFYAPERFFARHRGKTVFFGRFVAVLRVTAAWTAGLSGMNAWRFFAWDAAGGIVWATLVGLLAYHLGDRAAKAINTYGLYAAGRAILLAALGYLVVRWIERRVVGPQGSTGHSRLASRSGYEVAAALDRERVASDALGLADPVSPSM
jgi:membrane protein DedA with SNARE-associated domain